MEETLKIQLSQRRSTPEVEAAYRELAEAMIDALYYQPTLESVNELASPRVSKTKHRFIPMKKFEVEHEHLLRCATRLANAAYHRRFGSCEICGKWMTQLRRTKNTCSNACR